MSLTRRTLTTSLVAAAALPAAGRGEDAYRRSALIVALGGGVDAGAAFEAAAAQAADMLAGGLVCSKDGVLVVRPDIELSGSTDVAAHPEYADRRTTKFVREVKRDGWFVDDFTLNELKSLAAVDAGARPVRPAKGQERPAILTLEEFIGIARRQSVKAARVVGIWLRLTAPGYFERADLALEPKVARTLRLQGYDARAAAAFVVTPDPASLARLKELTGVRLVLDPGAPPDGAALAALAAKASAITADALQLIAPTVRAMADTGLTTRLHQSGLGVHAIAGAGSAPWPPPPLRPSDSRRLFEALARLGVEAIVTRDVATAVRGREAASRPAGR